ncbi:putative N-acetylmannosamine-6-phosphate 2-epimerase [Paenibacillus baekrokdamisoli]|uniref:Putative N-acetylmannosamine-6-phosphate 2-epimerase n=1 Tax=Paenibacillus baekrokdamisoli TaxID=1712516 RepID=A0A3G9JGQ9_9BACL|nr:N-acetylmannosamine-6-phosphate 2-epimerase [Paenibacillus baekrokdamisoli]MBB3072368.1 N-acylglucosamine-6-phosphate 2-epimerase [Paenibacillus baekrokdamisoli]BBH23238.1 putative N-acetylmannosamine-6-phosphate 2-epimerase [Paenibacillus baekrokdamisoli]
MTINNLKHGLVVSCQALSHEPLHGSQHMVAMARAAQEGGAVGIRSNSPEDVRAISSEINLPIIGLWKKDYDGFDIYITPTVEDAIAMYEAGAAIVALDATSRPRPDGRTLEETIAELKKCGIPIMADISTYEEGIDAARFGADYISTTLSGYTPYSVTKLPNLELVYRLSETLTVPIVAEGGISTPEEARQARENGAHFVVVGSAITRPQLITAQFANVLSAQRIF